MCKVSYEAIMAGKNRVSRCIMLVVVALVAAARSQSHPYFEFRGSVLANNSYIYRPDIGEGHSESLHCVSDNSECCNNGQGHWYDTTGASVQNRSDGDSDLYVTRGVGLVYLNRRRGGSSGMLRCDIPDNIGELQSIFIYTGELINGVSVGSLTSSMIYFELDSDINEDPPEFTLTCQSKGGPATEVVWTRNGVIVEEDSNHMTSQIIVNTSAIAVYNNTLRVRGRETGNYECNVTNNIDDFINNATSLSVGQILLSSTPHLTSLTAKYLSPTYVLLDWTYNSSEEPTTNIIQYIVYYELGETYQNMSLIFGKTVRRYSLTGNGDIGNVYLVAISQSMSPVYLPSPTFGPADLIVAESPVVMVSGEGSGVAGTSYNLSCRVSLPSGVVPVNLDIKWVELASPQLVTISPGVYILDTTIIYSPTNSTYTCTASYKVNGISSRVVEAYLSINTTNIGEVSVVVRGLGRREVGSVYTLICTVTLSNRVTGSSVSIHWQGPSTDQPHIDNTDNTMITSQLSLDPLTLAHGGNYTCTAIYTVQERSLTSSNSKEVIPIEPVDPVKPANIEFRDVKADSVLVQWTVSHISYSPETYVVQFGTSRESLEYNSSLIHSKDGVTTYSVELSGLRPNTTYYVQVLSINTAQRSSRSDVQGFTILLNNISTVEYHVLRVTVSESVGLTPVIGGILSFIIISIIGVSALGYIILIIKIRRFKSKLTREQVAAMRQEVDIDIKSVPADSNEAYGAMLRNPMSRGDVAMYEVVDLPPLSSSTPANPEGDGPSDYIEPSQTHPTSEFSTYEVIATVQ